VGLEGVSATTATTSRRDFALAFVRDLRSPRWGLAGQGIRFVISGCVVAIVYVTLTLALHDGLGVPFQIALVIGFVLSVALHFTLQRVFVWRHYERFALATHHQAVRYLGLSASQYALTALSTSRMPAVLGLPLEVVYVATMITLASVNFVVFRGRVFHPVSCRDSSSRARASP
jgi:putative flippase GtrA